MAEFADPLTRLFNVKDCIILDGALATELEARGVDLNHALWSAKAISDHGSVILDVHHDYFKAGADIAITASYQASARGFSEYLGLDNAETHALIVKSVDLAQEARKIVLTSDPSRVLLVAGSVGPYGAYLADGSEYRGDYTLSFEDLKAFHRLRMQALCKAGVDLVACETLPSMTEVRALLNLLEEEFPTLPAWFSLTLRDAKHISDGSSLEDVVTLLNRSNQVVALGINCVPKKIVEECLIHLRQITNKPMLVYPNAGGEWDAATKSWSCGSESESSIAESAMQWHLAGAELIGTCCGSSPADTESISRKIRDATQ